MPGRRRWVKGCDLKTNLKIKIGASIVGTRHETLFKVDSVWRKVCNKFPDALQAANKVCVEDARAQWTTCNNFNQWFGDRTCGWWISSGCRRKLVSEVRFRKDSQRCIIYMDETHHSLAITGDRGGSSMHHISMRHFRGVQREEWSLEDTLQECTPKMPKEKPYLHSISSTPRQHLMRTFASRWIGLWVFLQSKGGFAVQLILNLKASMQFDLKVPWTNI